MCLMVEFYYQPAESLHHFAFEERSNLTNGFTFSTAGRRQRLVEEEEREGGRGEGGRKVQQQPETDTIYSSKVEKSDVSKTTQKNRM